MGIKRSFYSDKNRYRELTSVEIGLFAPISSNSGEALTPCITKQRELTVSQYENGGKY